ncbi:TPA: ATP-binding cassette domain-containing protein, partial [Candidatus Micrarchaeota archaeon]|nr:ATP-binding cassette domain-containing protein [Candidatus Micrarchaeota archaeon]
MNALEIRNLRKTYGNYAALDGVSFSIPQGTVFGLLGPNGAGKSTLISILTGLVEPDSGDITVLGLDLKTHSRQIRLKTNFLRGFSGVPRGLTAPELLEYYMRLYECWDEKKALCLLGELGLKDNRSPVS